MTAAYVRLRQAMGREPSPTEWVRAIDAAHPVADPPRGGPPGRPPRPASARPATGGLRAAMAKAQREADPDGSLFGAPGKADAPLVDAVLRSATAAPDDAAGRRASFAGRTPAEAKRAGVLDTIRTMGRWNNSDADILPQAAAQHLGREIVVSKAGQPDQRFVPDGAAKGGPVALTLAGRHWTVTGRDRRVPDNGDCFYHGLLLAVGASDWRKPSRVGALRHGMAATVEADFHRFSPYLLD